MNDFTKEELEEIQRCLKYIVKSGINPYSCVTLDAKKKVHSMIDNYCEHRVLTPEVNAMKCMGCKRLFDGKSIYCKCEGQWVCDECHHK